MMTEKSSLVLSLGGEEIEVRELEVASKIRVSTIYGEVTLQDFEDLVRAKINEYAKFGIARRVWDMMQEQQRLANEKGKNKQYTTDDLKLILLEMSRLEVKYDLQPIQHLIPIDGKTYVLAEGYLYYAKKTGKLKSITWKDSEKDGTWTSICHVETDTGTYEGVAFATPTRNYFSDPREKARTKAMRRALRKAFPVGADAEPLEDLETWSSENHSIEVEQEDKEEEQKEVTDEQEDPTFDQMDRSEQLMWIRETDKLLEEVKVATEAPNKDVVKKIVLQDLNFPQSRKWLTRSQLQTFAAALKKRLEAAKTKKAELNEPRGLEEINKTFFD